MVMLEISMLKLFISRTLVPGLRHRELAVDQCCREVAVPSTPPGGPPPSVEDFCVDFHSKWMLGVDSYSPPPSLEDHFQKQAALLLGHCPSWCRQLLLALHWSLANWRLSPKLAGLSLSVIEATDRRQARCGSWEVIGINPLPSTPLILPVAHVRNFENDKKCRGKKWLKFFFKICFPDLKCSNPIFTLKLVA